MGWEIDGFDSWWSTVDELCGFQCNDIQYEMQMNNMCNTANSEPQISLLM